MLARATRVELAWRLRSMHTLGSAWSLSLLAAMSGILWRVAGEGRELAISVGLIFWMCMAVGIGAPLRQNTAGGTLGFEGRGTRRSHDWVLSTVPASDANRATAVLSAMAVFSVLWTSLIYMAAAWLFAPLFQTLIAVSQHILSALLCAGAGLDLTLRSPTRTRLGVLLMVLVGVFVVSVGGPPLMVAVAICGASRLALYLPAWPQQWKPQGRPRQATRLLARRRLGGHAQLRHDLLRNLAPLRSWFILELIGFVAALVISRYVFEDGIFPGYVMTLAVLFATHSELGLPNTTIGVQGRSDAGLAEACAALPVAPGRLARACLAHGLIRSFYLATWGGIMFCVAWPEAFGICGVGHALALAGVFGLAAFVCSGTRVLHRFRSANRARRQVISMPTLVTLGILVFSPTAGAWRTEGLASLSLILLFLPAAAMVVAVRLRALLSVPPCL